MMDGIALANNIAVGLYGMILSAAFCDMTWTARRRWVFTGCMAAILALQGVVTWRFAAETTRYLYPLITHLALAVTLGVMNRRALWPTIAVLTAYLCCQLRRWIALLIVALLHSGDAMQSIAELIVTLPLLLALLRFVAPAVRKGSRFPRIMQWEFGVIPALGYAFDYLTRVYTDLLVQGVPAAVEFMPFVCCVAYLIFVLHSALENALRACRAAQEQGLPCDADVMAYEKDGSLFLQISNACAGEVLFENGVPVTHVSGHGIGVQSICGIVERYGGVYDFSLRDGRFILRVSL